MTSRRVRLWIIVGTLCVPLAADQPPAAQDSSERLIAQERARGAVEAALEDYLSPTTSAEARIDGTITAVEHLATVGPEVVPYLINELEHEIPGTFDFCAYALGYQHGPEAEAALREAMKRADEVDNSFGRARKAWAGWGLALQGKAESVDLFNEGKQLTSYYTMHDDTTVIESAGLLTAPESIPLLLAQLEEHRELKRYRTWTLRALPSW